VSHSPEPWRLVDSGFGNAVNCEDANGVFISGYSSDEGTISQGDPNWERIVACVNACVGIPTERLAQMDLQEAVEILDSHQGNIDCHDYCGVAKSLTRRT
jgi:hypothetical protein